MKPYDEYKHILMLNLNGHSIIIGKSNNINDLKKIADDTKVWLEQINENHNENEFFFLFLSLFITFDL